MTIIILARKISTIKYAAGKKNETPSMTVFIGTMVYVLRDCGVSYSFVTVIGNQMAFRRPVFAPSILTLQAVTVVYSEVNNVCTIHSSVQPCHSDEYVLLLNNFSHLNVVAL